VAGGPQCGAVVSCSIHVRELSRADAEIRKLRDGEMASGKA